MNKRQKKKLYCKVLGANPPKWLRYTEYTYHFLIGKPWGGWAEAKRRSNARWQQLKKEQEINNLVNLTRILSERRYKR